MPGSYVFYLDTELGRLGLAEREGALTDVFFSSNVSLTLATPGKTPLLREAARQIRDYLDGRRRVFTLPLTFQGTEFQKQVWRAVLSIPYGQTRSYQQIARDIGRPRAARGVGTAIGLCPMSILVPCHRVIKHNGSLAGNPEDMRRRGQLLALERGLEHQAI